MSNANMTGEKKRRGIGCLGWLGRVALGASILVLGLVAVGAIYQAVASAREAQMYKPVDQMIDVNGTEMRLDCRGTGSPTVVLEAGAESSSIYWWRIQDDVAKFTRVCSYDRAGYGWSEPVREQLFPQQVAGMLHDLLEKGGEQPPYLMVGHSFGGIYVRTFTAQYPGEVVGMVLVDSAHENQAQKVPAEIAESPEFAQLRQAQSLNLQIYQIAAPIGLFRAFKLLDPAVASLKLAEAEKGAARAEMYHTDYFGAYAREVEMMTAYEAQPGTLGSLGAMPLIVLSAKIDAQKFYEMYPPALQAKISMELVQQQVDGLNGLQDGLAALSSRGKRIVVEDTGHFIQLDAPQVVLDAIREVFGQIAG